jgi:putrescine transport system permease protein
VGGRGVAVIRSLIGHPPVELRQMTDFAAPASPVAATRDKRFRLWLDRRAWRDAVIAIPYVWLLFFFLLPFFIILAISLANSIIAIPPFEFSAEWPYVILKNFARLFTVNTYWRGYLNSVYFALIATVFCLLIGYPMALAIARTQGPAKNVLLLLVIMPFWTSFLLRVYAWIGLLSNNSWFNRGLTSIVNHLIPFWGELDFIPIMNTNYAVVLGLTYSYLPFMVLPLYANLERLDYTLNEAAMDLGSKPWHVFRDITLPLSVPGILAGGLLVFIPCTGELVIPSIMGRADSPMIGRVIGDEFFLNRDWPMASAVAVALLLLLVVPIMIYNNLQAREGETKP